MKLLRENLHTHANHMVAAQSKMLIRHTLYYAKEDDTWSLRVKARVDSHSNEE